MPEAETPPHQDEYDRFDEAQPFLQLLADMLNRLFNEHGEQANEVVETTEETAG